MAEAAGDIFGPINAETGDTSQWSSTVVGTNSMDVIAAAKNNGTYGFELDYAGSDGDLYGRADFSAQTQIYVRFYAWWPTGAWPDSHQGTSRYGALIEILDGSDNILTKIRMQYSSTSLQTYRVYHRDSASLTFTSEENVFTADQWTRVEMLWKQGNGNGEVRLWIDGSEVFTKTDLTVATETATYVLIGHHIVTGAPTASQYIYLDDIKANTTGPIGAYVDAPGGIVVLRRRRM